MKIALIIAATGVLALSAVFNLRGAPAEPNELVLYCGRSMGLVSPIIKRFEAETGIRVKVRYGKTTQLALAIKEAGDSSPADLFWGQDAGAMGLLAAGGRFQRLPSSVVQRVPEVFRDSSNFWVATSGRARLLAYAPQRVAMDELPLSIFDLTDPKWSKRVGWAPTNASFQSFVTAMRKTHGEDTAKQWLRDMDRNGTKRYAKNTPIIKALADGEIDLGLPNHYYLLRFKKADKHFPVEQTFFEPGDSGNLVNVAGMGIIRTSHTPYAAQRFIEFVLSDTAQQFFTSDVFEYPVSNDVITNSRLLELEELVRLMPPVSLEELTDLQGTLKVLKEVGLL